MRLFVPVTISLALLLAACGSSAKPAAGPSSTTPTTVASGPTSSVHVAKVATNVPSVSAKMICETEAQDDIYQSATGIKTISVSKPTWIDHVFSCDYVYPGGVKLTLAVKEVSNVEETTNYFDSLAAKLGKTRDVLSLGEGAFQVSNGSIVVRKDFKILLVDVTKLPAEFGVPADARGDVAINVAQTIMGCWVGA